VLAGAIARGLGRAGARIVLTDIAPLEVRLQELRQLGIEVYGYRMDVLDKADIERVAEQVKQEVGAVDVLLNAAAAICPKPLPLPTGVSSTCP